MNDMLTKPDRSNSVAFLIILSFVSAALYLLLIFMLWIASIVLALEFNFSSSPTSNWEFIPARRRDIATTGQILALSIAFSILIGVGLLMMHRWARVLGLVGYILLAISQLITIFTTTYYSNYVVMGPVISIVFVIVLNSRAVKQAFNQDNALYT